VTRRFVARSAAFVVAVSLSACMVGPDYRRPELSVPAAYEYEPKDAASTINTDWWRQFNDPVLDQLIVEALANNKSVKQAAANVEQAAALLTETQSQFYPQVGYDATGTRQQYTADVIPNRSGLSRKQTSYSVLASASWEIDVWGRIRRQTESAQANLLATDEVRRGVILSLLGQVANNYLTLRALDEQLEVSKKTLGTYEESLKLFQLQFQYGFVSQMTVAQAKSQYETAAAQIPAIEQEIVTTENAICILLGRNPGRIARGKALVDMQLPQTPAGLPSQLLERRPDVAQSEQELIAANAQIGAAKALYFPTISLTGALGAASADLSNLFKDPTRIWNYGGSLLGPIFTGGAITAQVRQAEGAQKAALYGYEKTVQSAFADVENSLITRQKSDEKLQAQQRLVDALNEYAGLARLQYKGGYVPYSTVLQAEQQLFPAELTLAQYRAQLYSSAVGVYLALGGGWVTLADDMTASSTQVERPRTASTQ